MQQVQDEVNKWERRMNTASRMFTEKQQWIQLTKTTRNTGGKGDTPITCYRCGGPHMQNVCQIKSKDVMCTKCNKQGHMAKVCQSRNGKQKEKNFARTTPSTKQTQSEETHEPPPEYANAARLASSTPPLFL